MPGSEFLALIGGELEPPRWLQTSDAAKRSRVLRAHWETPITSQEEGKEREECDGWLVSLSALELLIATGHTRWVEAQLKIPETTWDLLATNEVQRFLDDYDYFSVRMLLSRQGRPGFLPVIPASPPETDPAAADAAEAFLLQQKQLDESAGGLAAALCLLDDFILPGGANSKDWLQWLEASPERRPVTSPYASITKGAQKWIHRKAKLYAAAPSDAVRTQFALFDYYWITRLFDCAVTATGRVSSRPGSTQAADWVRLLGLEKVASIRGEQRRKLARKCCLNNKAVLRAAWVSVNTQIQKACATKEDLGGRDWTATFAEEIAELRRIRPDRDPINSRPKAEDVRTSLTGLAFSGGGIRSATFNLGVLEALRERELLRHFDYLSTVSGGGYIGGWLFANILHNPFWLRRGADWTQAIAHLRKYSNYLSPKVGLLSADSWTMFTIWTRNTLLLQLLVFLSLMTVLLVPHALARLFFWVADAFTKVGTSVQRTGIWIVGVALMLWASIRARDNLWEERTFGTGLTLTQTQTQFQIVIPFLVIAYICTAVIWGQIQAGDLAQVSGYGSFLTSGIHPASPWLGGLCAMTVSFWILASGSIRNGERSNLAATDFATLGAAVIFYLGLCCLACQFRFYQGLGPDMGKWLVFVTGPSLVLFLFTVSTVMLIGLMGSSMSDGQREWWSRLGAWFCIYGGIAAALQMIAIGGPFVAQLEQLHDRLGWVQWPAVGTWVLSTAAGLLAGRSVETNGGNGEKVSPRIGLKLAAAAGPPIFMAGLFTLAALVVFYVLERLSAPGHEQDYLARLSGVPPTDVWLLLTACVALAVLLGWRVDINIFSLNAFYKYRLSRCYLGAAQPIRNKEKWQFTGFNPADDVELHLLSRTNGGKKTYTGPIPVINCTLNSGGSSDLALHTRHGAPFTFTPLRAGSGWKNHGIGFTPMVKHTYNGNNKQSEYYCGKEHSPTLAQVMSVSGAAANPNMGFHTSPAVAFLMTVFNVRLGAWFPNPKARPYDGPSPQFAGRALAEELFGFATEDGAYLNLSDGGHFENLGIYELVRRRCRVIVASDAECDPNLAFEGLGNAIRLCETDFGARIQIDLSSIRKGSRGFSTAQCAIGSILYDDGSAGYLIYLKASLTGCEETAIREYRDGHPTFPHETTGNQFFSEPQFESYRKLGYAICARAFRDCEPRPFSPNESPLAEYARQMQDIWTPNLADEGKFTALGTAVQSLWKELRERPRLRPLLNEIMRQPHTVQGELLTQEIFCMTQEIFHLMENAYMDLALEDTWKHPDNSGLREMFLQFAGSKLMRDAWTRSRHMYGTRFQVFCRQQLDLPIS